MEQRWSGETPKIERPGKRMTIKCPMALLDQDVEKAEPFAGLSMRQVKMTVSYQKKKRIISLRTSDKLQAYATRQLRK